MTILGLNAYHGDVSAAILVDGHLVAAVEEERFNRIKHSAGLPLESIASCLAESGLSTVDHVAISRSPHTHLLRKAIFAITQAPAGRVLRDRGANALRVSGMHKTLRRAVPSLHHARFHFVEHHPAHLASAFFVSPFDQAAICAIDGFGDFVSTSWGTGRGSRLDVARRVFFPHSLGLLYLAITQYLGFPKYGDEYKVMGLASYGSPDYVSPMRKLVRLHADGDFSLNLDYFQHQSVGTRMAWESGEPVLGRVFTAKLEELLGPARRPDEPVEPRQEAIAASLQVVFEEAAFHVLNAVFRQTKLKQLCLAGGCAMNSVMNGKIREQTPFEELYIQPAAGDNGTALGAALYVQHHSNGAARNFVMDHSYWGPQFSEQDVLAVLSDRAPEVEESDCRTLTFESDDTLCAWTADRIARGQIVGWFQGRMEWGARALGNRSILADPRRSDMRNTINTKIKFREKFRPFAPSILEEALNDYFVGAVPDPFMIQVYPVCKEKRDIIPAVTHIDGTGRLQTVSRTTNPLYWALIRAFQAQTGVPVLLNTSFNENEPIVLRPTDALSCFLRTDMDILVMGRQVLLKTRAVTPGSEVQLISNAPPQIANPTP